MPSTRLGKDATRYFKEVNAPEASEPKKPSRITRIGRATVMTLMAVLAVLSLGTGATAKAGIWDFKDQLVAQVMNICNPNEVPVVTDTTSWVDSALGSTLERPVKGENKNGNIWSTYNPMVVGSGGSYVPGGSLEDVTVESARQPAGATLGWVNFLRSKDGNDKYVYSDNYSDRSKIDSWGDGPSWVNAYKGNAAIPNAYAVNPSNANAAYFNAPTVALQNAYSDAPTWVVHPSYTRYGFETLQWTTFGGGCYSPSSMLQGIPSFLYWAFVQIPTLMTFGMLRITLGGELSGIFYNLIYPITSLLGTFIKPWAALIAIFIGLPFIFGKSKGRVQQLLGGALWIAAMMFAIGFISNQNNSRKFTEFTQGLVVKVSGTMACTISQQAFSDGQITYVLGGDAIKGDQQTPVYDPKTGVQTGWETIANAEQRVKNAAAEQGLKGNEPTTLTLDDLRGVSNNTNTACGSYLDGIYNAFWLGIPLQVWAEGEVGASQAGRDRAAETSGKVGWYQAILNSMYVNPNDTTGRAQLEATSRWNDAPYTNSRGGKPVQWTRDGNKDGELGDIHQDEKVTTLDDTLTATPWKTIPFLLNVKFMCKDDTMGSTDGSFTPDYLRDDKAMADYAANKWLYDGTCITGADSGLIAGVAGYNFVDRIGLALVGGWLAGIVGFFTIAICVYIGYQKFLWGWMLLFSPIILGIAAFPDPARRAFARRYFEWCLANILKQVVAVMILVTSVTALGRIVFPQAVSVGDHNVFYVPWAIKPFVALMFMLSAVLFALPLRKIMVGAVKGDSSVINKVAEIPGDAAKAAGVAAAAVAITAGTGGAASGALLTGAGRIAQGTALRKGGMTGALASLAHEPLNKMGDAANASVQQRRANKMAALAQSQNEGQGHKKSMGTAAMSQRAALAANKQAEATGQTLPYAVDKAGNLTKAAQKQARQDFIGAQKGEFWKSPEFSAVTRNESLNGQKLEGIKEAMKGDYLDATGNVKNSALNLDAKQELSAMNAGTLDRQKAIGQEMIKSDLAKPVEERRYLDKSGTLTADGQKKLFADIRGADENGIRLANSATASQLLAENADHYNQFSTPEEPNGNYRVALQDANMMNFGSDGAIGSTPVHQGFAGNLEIQPIKGTQAYVSAHAPQIGTDLTATEASATTQELAAAMPTMSDSAQSAMTNYANVLGNENSTHEETVAAHRNALVSMQESGNLTQTAATVQDNVLSPVEQGMSLTPAAIRQVQENIPEESVGVRNSLSSYANVVEEHGSDSSQARSAFDHVRDAVIVENDTTYAMAASNLPTPVNAVQEYADEMEYYAPVAPAPAEAPTPAMPAPAASVSDERQDAYERHEPSPSVIPMPSATPRDSEYREPERTPVQEPEYREPVQEARREPERTYDEPMPPAAQETPATPIAPAAPAERDYSDDRRRADEDRPQRNVSGGSTAVPPVAPIFVNSAPQADKSVEETPAAMPEPREPEQPDHAESDGPARFERGDHVLYGGIADAKRKVRLDTLRDQITKMTNKINQLQGLAKKRKAESEDASLSEQDRQNALTRHQNTVNRVNGLVQELNDLKAEYDQISRG